jgi:Zn-dependent membrane protease YugP
MIMGFDPLYMLLFVVTLALTGGASLITHLTFRRYAKVPTFGRITGAEAALRMLRMNGVAGVKVERVEGFLSDHYDPAHRVLRLSPDVHDGSSLSSVGVACHEAGHALQHAEKYAPLVVRTAMVPAAMAGNNFGYLLIVLGFVLQSLVMVKIGIGVFALAVLFSIVTLPVEWDASARAKRQLVQCGIVGPGQETGAGAVLNAAFLTYLAGAVTALLTLLYYLFRAGLIGGRRDD